MVALLQRRRPTSSWVAAPRAAVGLFLLLLVVFLDLATARMNSRRGIKGAVKNTPLVQDGSFAKVDWRITRDFFFKRDQAKNGADFLTARENKLAKFNNSGEVGYWKLVRRPIPGARKRQSPLGNEGIDYLVLDIPEQGPRRNLIVSYEIPISNGRYHPSSIMFAQKGTIYVANAKEQLVGPAAATRKKIGSFSVDLPTLEPMVDRTFTL
ncbi:unnamed protein product [Ectocarpus sp. 12 AP-2014]